MNELGTLKNKIKLADRMVLTVMMAPHMTIQLCFFIMKKRRVGCYIENEYFVS